MHGPEESDSVIVAVKPTNKAEQSVAEPVEPRTETKGNADQQSTRRAQDRASVSQALDRVRQAARQRKKERFTSLWHHVDPAMLRTAFYAMKRDAAPGVDGMTWETYGVQEHHREVSGRRGQNAAPAHPPGARARRLGTRGARDQTRTKITAATEGQEISEERQNGCRF